MRIEKAVALEEAAHKRRMEIRQRKAHDYAKEDADCLSNFKVMADVEKALGKHGYRIPIDKSYGVAFWHMLHKMIRILNLWNERADPQNESLEDTHDDLSNYNDLAKECYMDDQPKITSDKIIMAADIVVN